MKLSKLDAAIRHIEAAIAAFEAGHFDIAITLAGAAEGMLPRLEHSLFDRLLNSPRVAGVDRKKLVAELNGTRDWLKHVTADKPQVIEVPEAEALFLITRAMSHVPPDDWNTRMVSFRPVLLERLKQIK